MQLAFVVRRKIRSFNKQHHPADTASNAQPAAMPPLAETLNELLMKLKHALIIIVFGFCFDFIGTLLKILHAPNADNLLIIGTILKVFGTLLLLYKILTHPKAKEFLDW